MEYMSNLQHVIYIDLTKTHDVDKSAAMLMRLRKAARVYISRLQEEEDKARAAVRNREEKM